MKTLSLIFSFTILYSLFINAQNKVNAGDIIEKINNNENQQYENATIVGILDFTKLDNMSHKGNLNDKNYESKVEVNLIFRNCEFKDDVLAFIHDEKEKASYTAHFNNDAIFESCNFYGKVYFKYSKFNGNTSFKNSNCKKSATFKYAKFNDNIDYSNCNFGGEANFKYAEFDYKINFSNSNFDGNADFKYTKFPQGVDFSNCVFSKYANFKYVKFKSGVNFKNTQFNHGSDFKYTNFKSPTILEGIEFNGSTDFKYTKVDGEPFVDYLLKAKKSTKKSIQ